MKRRAFTKKLAGFGLAFGLALSAGSIAMQAQQASRKGSAEDSAKPLLVPGTDQSSRLTLQAPGSDLQAPEPAFSSSAAESAGTEIALNTPLFHFNDAMQYGGRRRYGKPRYRGNNTNADGSSKWAFVVGGGMTAPVNGTEKYNTISYSVKVGAGRNFNKMFGVLAEYNYDQLGLTASNLANQLALYNSLGYTDSNNNLISFDGLDGNAHAWSLTLNPIIHLYDSESLGFYVVGGGGFYRKLTNFTLPVTGYTCNYYYGCYYYGAQQTIDHYSNNAGGVNGGIGFTYKLSKFANQKLFAEARYTWINNSQSNNSVNGLYPQNNLRTIYVPVTFGLRW